MGRGRALEVALSADDIPGELAELYGYVNRSLPDADLDGFVDALAIRIASFDKQTIMDTKRLVNVASLPNDIEIESGWDACVASMGRRYAAENQNADRARLLQARRCRESPGVLRGTLSFHNAAASHGTLQKIRMWTIKPKPQERDQ